jgi:hypothetical protein
MYVFCQYKNISITEVSNILAENIHSVIEIFLFWQKTYIPLRTVSKYFYIGRKHTFRYQNIFILAEIIHSVKFSFYQSFHNNHRTQIYSQKKQNILKARLKKGKVWRSKLLEHLNFMVQIVTPQATMRWRKAWAFLQKAFQMRVGPLIYLRKFYRRVDSASS